MIGATIKFRQQTRGLSTTSPRKSWGSLQCYTNSFGLDNLGDLVTLVAHHSETLKGHLSKTLAEVSSAQREGSHQ